MINVQINGRTVRISDASTVAEAVWQSGVEDPRGVAVALDGEVVPAADWHKIPLSEGRQVEILRAVQGGAA